jgi:hypothetical protein
MPSIETNRRNFETAKEQGTIVPVLVPSQVRPIPVPNATSGELNPYLRSPLPASSTQQPDQQRQWRNNAVPQQRISPLPPNTLATMGAQAASQVHTVAPAIVSAAASTAISTVLPGTVIPQDGTISAATLNSVMDSGMYGRVLQTALTNNAINPAKPGFLAKGTVPPTLNAGFTYTSTTTSITWTWTGLVVYRADGTTNNITNGSQAITGLSSNTTYYFYPYVNDLTGASTVLWVTQSAGSPAYAATAQSLVSAQSQTLQNLIPLSTGAMPATTPSSGSGGGGGGGSGTCLHEDMLIETKRVVIPIKSAVVGDEILTPSGFESVTSMIVRPCSTWLRVETESEEIVCTPTHPFTLADGDMKRAESLSLSDLLIGRNGEIETIKEIGIEEMHANKVSLTVEPGHVFFAGTERPSILVHNVNYPS